MTIPSDWLARAPSLTERAWQGLAAVLQHEAAPRWNQTIGDRVGPVELEALAEFRREIANQPLEAGVSPSAAMVDRVETLRERLLGLSGLPRGFDVARDWTDLPTTRREDIVRRLEDLVPIGADLEPAIVYSTSGTTGHPVIVPSHPAAMAKNLAHLELLASLHGATLTPREGEPFALNVSAQQRTFVFATTVSGWAGAVFAKLNLAEHDWAGGAASRRRFVAEMSPAFIASEPVTMAEMMRLELPVSPAMIVSSAVTLTETHAALVAERFGTKVVDLYSSTETGPIAASVPGIAGHVVLLPDVFVEALDPFGIPVPDGERGELAVTGGRNPYLPLVRYRMGDHGRLGTVTLPDGRSARVIRDLEGRAPVAFVGAGGAPVTSVDVARTIRPIGPFVQHTFVQRADRSVELTLRPVPGVPVPLEGMESALRELFGRGVAVTVALDPTLGQAGGKLVAWRTEL